MSIEVLHDSDKIANAYKCYGKNVEELDKIGPIIKRAFTNVPLNLGEMFGGILNEKAT